jgi:hypothetical protein
VTALGYVLAVVALTVLAVVLWRPVNWLLRHKLLVVAISLPASMLLAQVWPVSARDQAAGSLAHSYCARRPLPAACAPSGHPWDVLIKPDGTGPGGPGPSAVVAPLAVAPLAPLAAPGQPIVTDTRPLFPDVPPGGYPHSVYAWGQCTWWAAYNRRVPSWAPPAADGDAGQWLSNAQRDGLPTSAAPSVGAIVVYRAGATYSSFGHVGIVVALGPGGYRVSEMNFVGLNVVDQREAPWPDGNVEGFIPR